jgi:hypothetical protein
MLNALIAGVVARSTHQLVPIVRARYAGFLILIQLDYRKLIPKRARSAHVPSISFAASIA